MNDSNTYVLGGYVKSTKLCVFSVLLNYPVFCFMSHLLCNIYEYIFMNDLHNHLLMKHVSTIDTGAGTFLLVNFVSGTTTDCRW
jgi:hypothetical protein